MSYFFLGRDGDSISVVRPSHKRGLFLVAESALTLKEAMKGKLKGKEEVLERSA